VAHADTPVVSVPLDGTTVNLNQTVPVVYVRSGTQSVPVTISLGDVVPLFSPTIYAVRDGSPSGSICNTILDPNTTYFAASDTGLEYPLRGVAVWVSDRTLQGREGVGVGSGTGR